MTVRRLKRNAFALVLGFIFICASAALASVPPNFSGGSGTPESPYYISSSEDLSALAQRVMRLNRTMALPTVPHTTSRRRTSTWAAYRPGFR